MKHLITRSLNLVARFYDPFLKLTMDEEKFRQEIIGFADLDGNERVLDIGCGTGTLDLMLAETLDSGHIYAIDVDPKMMKVVRRRPKGNE
jgi:ubiquinone/menaquinone biosynthesis C-methylase UbiE